MRVGVIGGGIAGCAAAWSLQRAGFEVELFEANPLVGGNAKTHAWRVGDRTVVTGLSVLAWPRQFFKNYERLIRELGVSTEDVTLRFFIRRGDAVYAQSESVPTGLLAQKYARDIERWKRLVALVERVNGFYRSGGVTPSLYDSHVLNPMNFVTLRTLARTMGVSSGFWNDVVVAVHSSSFLTTKLDSIPAMIAPVLESMIAIDRGAVMGTWSGSSSDVFTRMLEPLGDRVYTGAPVTRVSPTTSGITIESEGGPTRQVDKVVFACNASMAARALEGASRFERSLLEGVAYSEDKDRTFLWGHVHGDETVLPEAHRTRILADYCNYVEVHDDPTGGRRYANHFVLSSWVPSARGCDQPMLVLYEGREKSSVATALRTISNRRAHPELSAGNLARMALMRFVQGKRGIYYCGSYTTPGNGHDLSLLSGLVAASAIGAPYPFADDEEAERDFTKLRRLMLG